MAVPAEATQAQVDEARRSAREDIYERAAGRRISRRLAVAYSNSQTALEGGSLGWRKGPELPTMLAEIVVGLKPGEVSQPLVTPTGFHLVKLNEMRSTDGSHDRGPGACAPHPDEAQRAAGRRHGAPAAGWTSASAY